MLSRSNRFGAADRARIRNPRHSRLEILEICATSELHPGQKSFRNVLAVFDSFDREERQTEEQRHEEKSHQSCPLPKLRRVNTERHREAAREEYRGVERAEPEIAVMAAERKGLRIGSAIHHAGDEQSTEE